MYNKYYLQRNPSDNSLIVRGCVREKLNVLAENILNFGSYSYGMIIF